MNDDQREEIEALQAIYEEEFTEISRSPPCFMIKLGNLPECFSAGSMVLKVTFPAEYPSVCPVLEVPMRNNRLSNIQISSLVDHLYSVGSDNLGMAMIFTLMDEAQRWLNDNVTADMEGSEPTDSADEEKDKIHISPVKMIEPKVTGGLWDYTIGLVGKPSAGKSTFFNACTSLDLARTGAHPFTTIEPNIGKAFYAIPCPCARLGNRCDTAFGHDCHGNRLVPVLIKDVAGLVPGAWEGKGKGNRFLNDLLDADVLIHIVDISGLTNEKGEQTTDYDPANDIHWLQQELHQWIYQNVMDKWEGIVKRPKKLIDMFTGYHATKNMIHAALATAGVGERELGNISRWDDQVLHSIVKEFLCMRFPMLLVLNKADLGNAEKNIKSVTEKYPDTVSIPVSARGECLLQQLVKEAIIEYQHGADTLSVSNPAKITPAVQQQLKVIDKDVLQKHGSTNVQRALSRAVSLRSPTYAFPVQCLDTLRSVRKGHTASHLQQEILRDCVSLKPGSTVEDLYTAMQHYPLQLVTGEFVRAESVDETKKIRPVKKDEVINEANSVIHIMTNKKS